MKKIDQYIIREFTKIFSLNICIFTMIYVVVNFFEHIDQFSQRHVSVKDTINYFSNKLPLIVFQITPFAILLSTILTLSVFSKNNEINILKGSGISMARISIPFMSMGIIASIFLFSLSEYLIPLTVQKANYLYQIKIKREKEESLYQKNNLWLYGQDRVIWNIKFSDPRENILRGVSVFQFKKEEGIKQRIDADWIQWQEGKWEFNNVYLRNFEHQTLSTVDYFPKKIFSFSETPQDFIKKRLRPEEMNFTALKNFIKKSNAEGFDTSRYKVDLLHKISFPFIAFIMTVLGIPLCLYTNKSGAIKLGIGLSLLVSFSVWVFLSFGISLGRAGVLPPFLAAWGSNIIFLLIGLYLLLTAD